MVQTATATCYCGAVQIEVVRHEPITTRTPSICQKVADNGTNQPVEGKDLIDTFVCNCTDCRKITASMFASNFIITDSSLKHIRGEDKLTKFAQSETIASGNNMANFFCSVCGTLMYRRSSGFPGLSIPRIGTVDDFDLHETKLKPRVEQFCKDRVAWFGGGEGVPEKADGQYAFGKDKK